MQAVIPAVVRDSGRTYEDYGGSRGVWHECGDGPDGPEYYGRVWDTGGDAEFAASQLDCVFTDIFPDAVKIGMLFSEEIVRVTARKLRGYRQSILCWIR